ncbi:MULTISPECIES: MFS transporter [unclassified Pseudomonas]|uniref:MFS transporter n=1 Tax=unclassified Pseudomonas TaxID=196821 RepID=UPI0028E0A25B|nr:MFS transporter [Pseudomonas sp. HD6422]
MKRFHILLLLLMSLLGVFPLDVILPSFHALASEYGVEVRQVSYSVSMFVIAVALAQTVIGPLSDWMGRKRLLLAGLAVAVIGSAGCIVAPNYTVFMGFRIIQALGCGCFVLSQALVEDTYCGRERNSMRILLSSVSGLFISFSPLAGSLLQQYLGWRASFWVFIVIAIFVGMLAMLLLEERPAGSVGSRCFHSYGVLGRDLPFLGYSWINALGFACHFSFIVVSPILLMERLGLSSWAFSWVFVGYGFSFIIGGWVARQINHRVASQLQIKIGLVLIGGAGLLGGGWLVLGGLSVVGVVIPMIVCTTATTVLRPAATTHALSRYPEIVGAAASLATTIILAIGGAVSSLVSMFQAMLPLNIMMVLVMTSVFGLLLLDRMTLSAR